MKYQHLTFNTDPPIIITEPTMIFVRTLVLTVESVKRTLPTGPQCHQNVSVSWIIEQLITVNHFMIGKYNLKNTVTFTISKHLTQ